jgi:two-component sensor histidine kinase
MQNKLKYQEITTLNNMYNEIVIYYTQTRQFNLAHKYILLNEKLVNKLLDPQSSKQHQFLSFQLDSAEGNYKGAMNHLIQFRKINDSLFTEKKSRQINQLEIEYQTEKNQIQLKVKDQSIRLLQQKEQIQQKDLKNAYLIKKLTFSGIFTLLVILALLYRQYRLKQKSNQVVQQNNILITQKNEMLQRLLREKEWLLKEVHHRVKNNLHTVICLLESQAVYLEDDALKAIESSQHRIYAMSLIHQKLYQAEGLKTIDMAVYLPELITYLNDSFGAQHKVRFHLDISKISLGISQAVPIALIVNEAVTNSIKYAFKEEFRGVIEISMHKLGNEIKLIVADNGIGIDSAVINGHSESLGLKLMYGLSEDINAQFWIENTQGTTITVLLENDPLNDEKVYFAENVIC